VLTSLTPLPYARRVATTATSETFALKSEVMRALVVRINLTGRKYSLSRRRYQITVWLRRFGAGRLSGVVAIKKSKVVFVCFQFSALVKLDSRRLTLFLFVIHYFSFSPNITVKD
jgi:hypothetical protein